MSENTKPCGHHVNDDCGCEVKDCGHSIHEDCGCETEPFDGTVAVKSLVVNGIPMVAVSLPTMALTPRADRDGFTYFAFAAEQVVQLTNSLYDAAEGALLEAMYLAS